MSLQLNNVTLQERDIMHRRTLEKWDIWLESLNDNAYLDGEHGDSLRGINVVPHAQIASVLCHNNITARDPL